VLNKLKRLIASCLGVGFIPGVPGTYGSAVTVAVFAAVGEPFGAAGWVAFASAVVVGLWASSDAPGVFGHKDPRPVVIDEFAGMWLTILIGGAGGWKALAVAFALFRVFDAVKPFPIKRLERIGGAAGIMADDLLAGVFAGLLTRAAAHFAGF
jgi:phosphatidylglycerophosphatase A